MSGSRGGLTIPKHGAFGRISGADLSRLPDREFYQKSTKFASNPHRQIQVFRDDAEIRRATDNFHCQRMEFAFLGLELFGCVVFSKLPRYEFEPLRNNTDNFPPTTRYDSHFLKAP